MEDHLAAVFRQLAFQDGGEFIFDAALEDLTARGDDRKLLLVEGQDVQDGLVPRCFLHGVHLFLLDDQRDDAGTGQFGSFFHRHVAVDGGDHHLRGAVDRQQSGTVDLEQAVAVGDQLDLALLRLGAVDVPARSGPIEQRGGFVLVEDAGRLFPDVQVLLADAQQHRDILRLDDVALAEAGAFELARKDLGDIVAEHLPCGVFGTDQFHNRFPLFLTARASGLRSSRPVPPAHPVQNPRPAHRPRRPAAQRKPAHWRWRCARLRSWASRSP